MEKYALSHLEELYRRSLNNDVDLSSPFYSEEELSEAISYLKSRIGKSFDMDHIHLFGGYEEADRKRIVFGSEERLDEEAYIGAMVIKTNNINFTGFAHREILGALMGLGLKRGLIGDILIHSLNAYVYYAKESETMVLSLTKVGRENVEVTTISLEEIPSLSITETRQIALPSLRLDTLIAHVFLLSREQAKEAINKGLVKVSQQVVTKNDYLPKEDERISLKGHGKFRYKGERGITKKGKMLVEVEVYI